MYKSVHMHAHVCVCVKLHLVTISFEISFIIQFYKGGSWDSFIKRVLTSYSMPVFSSPTKEK